MAKGKKTPPKKVYEIMASWATTNNFSETARNLGLPLSTVKKVVDENKDKPEFEELCKQKRSEFSEAASKIITKALKRLERDIDNEDKDIPVNHLTTVIGTLFDKKALADGKPTGRTEIVGGERLNKLAELAGYERKR